MADVVAYAHERGVKVHVTLNTLMEARDIAELPAYMQALDAVGVDAFIIGDLGAFSLARTHAPHVELHVSTQASVMNAEAARMWYELGARRVVCAREMSVADIAEMRANVPDDLEIEAFVHGAMCVAYSGRCLLSAAMTGRSGNKGACAQSCRWSYALVEEQRPGEYLEIEEDTRGTFILNAQDLNMIEHLDELAAAGVNSFKIEGRNKQAFYVATVVGAYRSVIDGGDAKAANRELYTISHRPYSTGFYYGRAEQTPERDGYVKECLHVATVEECVPVGEGRWRVTALCHNRFEEGCELEVVSPQGSGAKLTVESLVRLAPSDGGKPFVERGDLPLPEVRALSYEQPEVVANRSKEHYLFMSSLALSPGDYLRKRI
ncbi:MAG: U32 family peptidase, partial [Eggerthellaceae bacterium]|nr:U32 family peptidase [Eggerthellaceae bacterium]